MCTTNTDVAPKVALLRKSIGIDLETATLGELLHTVVDHVKSGSNILYYLSIIIDAEKPENICPEHIVIEAYNQSILVRHFEHGSLKVIFQGDFPVSKPPSVAFIRALVNPVGSTIVEVTKDFWVIYTTPWSML